MPIRSYNYKNGAVVGAALGVIGLGIGYFSDPNFQNAVKNSRLEEIIATVVTAGVITALPFSFGGYINQRFILPTQDKIHKKLEVYKKD